MAIDQPEFLLPGSSLLTILADLRAEHGDLLRQMSSELHEAASLVQWRGQQLVDKAFLARKYAWEVSGREGGRYGSGNKDGDVSCSSSSTTTISGSQSPLTLWEIINHEIDSSARDLQICQLLREQLFSVSEGVGCNFEQGIKNPTTTTGRSRLFKGNTDGVRDHVASLATSSDDARNPVDNLVAEKMAQHHRYAVKRALPRGIRLNRFMKIEEASRGKKRERSCSMDSLGTHIPYCGTESVLIDGNRSEVEEDRDLQTSMYEEEDCRPQKWVGVNSSVVSCRRAGLGEADENDDWDINLDDE